MFTEKYIVVLYLILKPIGHVNEFFRECADIFKPLAEVAFQF